MKKPSVVVSLGLVIAAAWLVRRFPILGRIL
jgi:hypothetical protein